MKIIHSGILGKGDEKKVCVYFESDKKSAEGYVPSCKIVKNNGFTDKELIDLEMYLKDNLQTILREATKINPIKSMMKDES